VTNRLRSFLLAVAASLGFGAFSPAHAVLFVPNPDPSQFVFIEGDGTYTIINNSTQGWYIWGFSVITDATDPGTTQPFWNAGPCSGGNCGLPCTGLLYEQFTGADITTRDIGPGQQSSLFTFVSEGTTPFFMVINPNNGAPEFATLTPTGSAVPEPSTWAMLIAGFGFLGWRYGLNRGGLRKLIGAA
jgi:hypothetical protein